MPATILLKLTELTDAGPFTLYSDEDGYVTPLVSLVTKNQLLAGYAVTVSDLTTMIKVQSIGYCKNYQIVQVP